MKLSKTEIEVLEGIQSNLRRGDFSEIARNTGFTKEYVGKVLSVTQGFYNERIVQEAVRIISLREQNTKKLLEKIPA